MEITNWTFEEVVNRLLEAQDFLEVPVLFREKYIFNSDGYANLGAMVFGLREIKVEENWPKFLPIFFKEYFPIVNYLFPQKVTHLYYPYYFIVSRAQNNTLRTYWTDGNTSWSFEMNEIPFETIFENVPEHLQERMIFYLDLFR